MEPLVTAAELRSRVQDELDEAAAQQAVANASGLVRGVARQVFSFVAQETIVLKGGERTLLLPEGPVLVDNDNPLTVVELGDYGATETTVVDGVGFTRIGQELTRRFSWYSNTRLMGWPYRRHLGVWAPRVRVTYSHGYYEIPGDIQALVLDVAQSLYTNPSGLRAFTTPEYSETYATELLGAATVESLRNRLSALGRRRTTHSI